MGQFPPNYWENAGVDPTDTLNYGPNDTGPATQPPPQEVPPEPPPWAPWKPGLTTTRFGRISRPSAKASES
jgi:hypothetical protein